MNKLCIVIILVSIVILSACGDTYNITGDNNSVGNKETVNGVNVEVPVDTEVNVEKDTSDQNKNTSEGVDSSDNSEKENETLTENDSNDNSVKENQNQQEKIVLSETHTPDDVVWGVSVTDWDTQNDYGIDGNRYSGGVKVEISNMFTSYGNFT